MAIDHLVDCLAILNDVAESVNKLKVRTKEMKVNLSDLAHEAQIKSFISELQHHTNITIRLNRHIHNLKEMLLEKRNNSMNPKDYEMINLEIDNAINTMRNSAKHINECITKVNFYLDTYKHRSDI